MSRMLILAIVLAVTATAGAQSFIRTHSGTTAAVPAVNDFLAALGDVDADGRADYALAGSTGTSVSVHSGATGAVLFDVFVSPTPFYNTRSYAFAGAGDVDDDGHDDILVGFGPGAGGSGGVFIPSPETVHVISGANGSSLHTLTGPQMPPNGESFGAAVAGLGDLDGDGHDDFAIGAPHAITGASSSYYTGRVEIRSGADASLLASLTGNPHDEYGTSLGAAGDIDGDGTPDMVVGYAAGGGSADVVSGADFTVLATYTLGVVDGASTPGNGYYLRHVNVEGDADVDGDGTPDIAVAAYREVGGGVVEVFSGATGSTLHRFTGNPGDNFGWNVDLGDLNADGLADIAVSTWNSAGPNEVTVRSGRDGRVVLATQTLVPGLTEVAIAGDVDGDAAVDLIVGREVAQAGATFFGVVRGGPWLGAAAESHVGSHVGPAIDVLRVNGDVGGAGRRVDVGVGQPFSVSLSQPPSNPQPADFVVFGALFAPAESHSFAVPGVVGPMTVLPAPLAPGAGALLFTLVASLPIPGALALVGPAPWSAQSATGLQLPGEFALQGVIADGPNRFAATNAVLVRIR